MSVARAPAESPSRIRRSATPRGRLKSGICVSILTLALIGCGRGSPIGRKDLFRFSDTLRSQATEGALLSQDAASGRSTMIFTHEHARDLFEAASQLENSLRVAETEPTLESDLEGLRSIASRVVTDLHQLGTVPDDLTALSNDLQAAAVASEQISERLT